jgi:hypothetical protein
MEEVRRGLVQYEDLTLIAAQQAAAELAAAEE